MYKKTFSGPRRHSSAPKPFSRRGGSSRFGSRRSGGRGRAQTKSRIDISKFINKAVITEEEVYIPTHHFSDFPVSDALKANIAKKGFDVPTPIQDKAIPHVLDGRDVVGIANTGTGKTAAFLIPLIHKVLTQKKEQVLIIVPTRELAVQIEKEFRALTPGLKLFAVTCIGGAFLQKQLKELRYHNDFVIGTPGRLKDLMDRGALDVSKIGTIVLDEADRMLDMGFRDDMRFIMGKMPENRHTLFFSATLSPEIEMLIGEFLNEPVRISVKTRDTSQNVDQDIVRIAPGKEKIEHLHDLLIQPGFEKVLVFCRTKIGAERLGRDLRKRGFKVEALHGDMRHRSRQIALKNFHDGLVNVLVATDVAARGLDVKGISHVINYDIPETYDDYVHRIGRTGRGKTTGKALTFV